VNEWPNTPDDLNDHHVFTITHPFHPLSGHHFVVLERRFAWGEERVFFHDPLTQELRSLPLQWTSLAPSDPFLTIAQGRTLLRFIDVQRLLEALGEVSPRQPEED